MDERRKDQRIVYRKFVQLTFLKVPGNEDLSGETYTCDASDISAGGICLHCEAQPTKGSTVRLKVMRPSPHKAFLMAGHVCWIRPGSEEQQWDLGIMLDESATRNSPDWTAFIAQLGIQPA